MFRTLLAGLAAALVAAPALAEPPIWVVRDKDSELVLFGSVHLLPPGLGWKTPALEAALRKADDLWYEVPETPETEVQAAQAAGRLGVLAPDQSLFKLMPPADAARLLDVARAYQVNTAVLDRLKPWLAEVMLAGAVYKRAGATTEDGVEAVTNAATPAAVPRRAFETIEEQLALFDGVPLADQIASLNESVVELQSDPGQYDDLIRAWMSKDVRALQADALEPMRKASPLIYARLVSERNDRWVKVLDARLKGSGRTVVVVGVGHLLGPHGVPAQLRALGYSVRGP